MKSNIQNVLYGFLIGTGMLIPGFSGGTVAVILGIYDSILNCVSNFTVDLRNNVKYLFFLGIGGILGFVSMARLVSFVLDRQYLIAMYFFIGVLLGGVWFLYKHNGCPNNKIKLLPFIFGIVIVIIFQVLPIELINVDTHSLFVRYLLYVISGLILAAALILPGISFSLMLMVLGLYQGVIDALKSFDVCYLLPIVFSVLFGIIVLSKLISLMFLRHPGFCHSLILGFVLASLLQLFPGVPKGKEIWTSFLFLFLGFLISIKTAAYKKEKA